MRIASVEVVPYALPFREPYVTARGTLERREMVLLRLRDEEGVVGLGEAVPLSLRGGASLSQVVAELEGLSELETIDETALLERGLCAPARCAAITALWDLGARCGETGEGAMRSFDADSAGNERIGVRCNATLVAGEPAMVAEEALRWAAEGFETFKLKLGTGEDVAQVAAVRKAVGPKARIRVDANEAWDVEAAIATLRELEPYEIELAEQPVAGLESMARVVAATSVPIAGDESIESRADAERARELGACHYTGVKLSKVGGPEEAVAIAEVLPAYLSSALDGPVGIAAAAQVAQTLHEDGGNSSLAHGLATQRLFAESVAAVECELREGMLYMPEGPGLGVEIDEASLAAHRL